MPETFGTAHKMIDSASSYLDVFGDCMSGDIQEIKTRYHSLMFVVHPDKVAETQRVTAGSTAAKLTMLYESALSALSGGTFGQAAATSLVFLSKVARHVAISKDTEYCDMSSMYITQSEFTPGNRRETLTKIARTPKDNELFMQEMRALQSLKNGSSEHALFYSKLIDSFTVTSDRHRLRVNVVERMDGFLNLTQIRKYRPSGLEPLHAAWIWRRLLWALGGAHEQGLVHGALLPQNVIVHPKMHGVVLVDWCYSVTKRGDSWSALKAVVGKHRAWYPVAVLAKEAVTPELDLMTAARTMIYLVGGDPVSMNMPSSVPGVLQRYLIGIVVSSGTCSAYELLVEFDAVLKRLGAPYYPRNYRELIL